ncbi:cAMP-binding protein [Arsukibacterium ikkense]|uniref:cAMP-binding protein n=1 Tax=Arsukibacterium ikkense TaxID=336831 RepID=A0A0M2V5B0_9GAMM|nr:Crp/Fnr family transcriptional regulator [Arsukibacterium ikkense]KKO44343.1 cAMP-binding protein [Arsukibacterium ikkense]
MPHQALTRHSIWFNSLNEAQQQQLLAQASYCQLAAEQRLFSRGDPFDGIYALLHGAVLISGVNRQGQQALLTIIEPGDWFGEIALFDNKPRTHDATASVDSTLLHLSGAALTQLLQQPLWWRSFGQLLTGKVRQVFQALEDISLQSSQVRLARRLLMLSRVHQQADGRWLIPIQQEQLGQLLSLSRQTINQQLQALAQQHIVRSAYGKIEILDREALLLLAELASANVS